MKTEYDDEDKDTRLSIFLVDQLKEHRILLANKKDEKTIIMKKVIFEKLIQMYKQKTGVELPLKSLVKKLTNMKWRLKEKFRQKGPGGMRRWEKDLLELIGVPVKSERNISADPLSYQSYISEGHESSASFDDTTMNEIPLKKARYCFDVNEGVLKLENEAVAKEIIIEKDTSGHSMNAHENITAVDIFSKYETAETENLNVEELKRLVLLKQNQLFSHQLQQFKCMSNNCQFN